MLCVSARSKYVFILEKMYALSDRSDQGRRVIYTFYAVRKIKKALFFEREKHETSIGRYFVDEPIYQTDKINFAAQVFNSLHSTEKKKIIEFIKNKIYKKHMPNDEKINQYLYLKLINAFENFIFNYMRYNPFFHLEYIPSREVFKAINWQKVFFSFLSSKYWDKYYFVLLDNNVTSQELLLETGLIIIKFVPLKIKHYGTDKLLNIIQESAKHKLEILRNSLMDFMNQVIETIKYFLQYLLIESLNKICDVRYKQQFSFKEFYMVFKNIFRSANHPFLSNMAYSKLENKIKILGEFSSEGIMFKQRAEETVRRGDRITCRYLLSSDIHKIKIIDLFNLIFGDKIFLDKKYWEDKIDDLIRQGKIETVKRNFYRGNRLYGRGYSVIDKKSNIDLFNIVLDQKQEIKYIEIYLTPIAVPIKVLKILDVNVNFNYFWEIYQMIRHFVEIALSHKYVYT